MKLEQAVNNLELNADRKVGDIMDEIISIGRDAGLVPVDTVLDKPWGGFVRFDTSGADEFIGNFFPEITLDEARLGIDGAELSPKFLLVAPAQRLSWQRHYRRAERWRFVTEGGYHKSDNPDEYGDLVHARPGDVVQFGEGECHRLVGDNDDRYTLVAEIWQHTNPGNMSNEGDIERIQDDYSR